MNAYEAYMLIHVTGAMVLVGALLVTVFALAGTRGTVREDRDRMLGVGFRSLLYGAIPAWVVMRVGAQLAADEGGWLDVDPEPAWIGIGFATAEPPLLLMIGAAVACRLAMEREDAGRPTRIAHVLVGLTLLACVVAIYAMTTKPT
jgi:hypothetical protein